MKILLTEDDFVTRIIMKELLSKYGQVDIAINGQEAVEAVKLSIESENMYDLILLDIMMPIMSGQEALKLIVKEQEDVRKLKKKEFFKKTEIVMTTALNDSKNVMTAFTEQCSGYLIKPITPSKLADKLTELELI